MDLKRKPYSRVPRTSQASLDARLLHQHLAQCQQGQMVAYAEIQEALGIDIQQDRHIWQTARRMLRLINGMLFDVVRDIGVVCLAEPGKLGFAERQTQRIGRASTENIRNLETVDTAPLTPDERLRYYGQVTVNAAVHLYTHEKTLAQLAAGQALPAPPAFDKDVHARLAALWR